MHSQQPWEEFERKALLEDERTRLAQFAYFTRWMIATALVFGGLAEAAGFRFGDAAMQWTGHVVLVYGVCVYIGRRILLRGHALHGIIWTCGTLLLGQIAVSILQPELSQALVLVSVIPAAITIQHHHGAVKKICLAACWSAIVVAAVAGQYLPPRSVAPDAVVRNFQFVAVIAIGCLVLFAMCQLGSRLHDRIEDVKLTSSLLTSARERIHKERARVDALMGERQTGMLITDEQGRVLTLNAAAAHAIGWPREMLLGEFLIDRLQFDNEASDAEDMLNAIYTGGYSIREIRDFTIFAKDGARRTLALTADVLKGEGDRMVGVMFTFRDLSEHAWRTAWLQMWDRMNLVRRFARGVASEYLRSCMSVRATWHALIDSSSRAEPVTTRQVDELGRAVSAIEGLTERLMAVAQAQDTSRRLVNLNDLLYGMGEQLIRTVGADIAFAIKPDPELWPVLVDVDQVEHALRELALRARIVMPTGGRIEFLTRNHVVTDDVHSGEAPCAPGEYVRLDVKDTGRGVARADTIRIFEPFSDATARRRGDIGDLTLAVAYGLIRQNGGTVTVESWPDVGSTVTVMFKRCRDPLHPASMPGRPTAAEARGPALNA